MYAKVHLYFWAPLYRGRVESGIRGAPHRAAAGRRRVSFFFFFFFTERPRVGGAFPVGLNRKG